MPEEAASTWPTTATRTCRRGCNSKEARVDPLRHLVLNDSVRDLEPCEESSSIAAKKKKPGDIYSEDINHVESPGFEKHDRTPQGAHVYVGRGQ